MIHNYSSKRPCRMSGMMIALFLGSIATWMPLAWADDSPSTAKAEAAAQIKPWLAEMDAGAFAQSWKDASASFQQAVTSDQWIDASNHIRAQLGKVLARDQVSALYQTTIPQPGGRTIKGEFVIIQYDTSFENLKYAVETVTFEKDPSGAWKASGYYIKPKI